jgi:lambda repressor-like predicted transcriptional regulator
MYLIAGWALIPKSKESEMSRVIKLCGLYERQIAQKRFNDERYYYEELDRILDELFEVAEQRGWSWTQLASEAGLAYQTVVNLGERWTNRPQFRTVLLVARAVDREFQVEEREGAKPVLKVASRRAG